MPGPINRLGHLSAFRSFTPLVIVFWLSLTANVQAGHEFPANGDIVSGVSLLRGFVCSAETISFKIDDLPFTEAVYGISRKDTETVCGDEFNGYAFLMPWSFLSKGVHHLTVLADDQPIVEVDFSVGGTGEEFISGLEHRGVTYGLPGPDSFCTFQWQTAAQNLQIAECARSRASGPGTDTLMGARTINVSSQTHGQQAYDAYIPTGYTESRPMALVVALHGAGGGAPGVRNAWALPAEPEEFIVVAPRAAGAGNVWEPGVDESWIAEVIQDISVRYNIEGSRIYLWGFSAGGHFAHALGLFGTDFYAAYAVSAGTLGFAGVNAPRNAPRTIAVILQIGNADTLQMPFVLDDYQRFLAAGWVDNLDVHLDFFPGGHTFTPDSVATAWNLMSLRTLPDDLPETAVWIYE